MTKKKIFCIIRKREVSNTPEERIRQEYLHRLIEEYGYPEEDIDVEVSIYIGSGDNEVKDVESEKPKRADIVIYRNKKDKEANERHYIIIECKKKDETNGKRQVKSYGNVTRSPILVWHNGLDTLYWSIEKEPNDWTPRAYLPKYGERYGDKTILKKSLRPATNLQATFKRIHNDIYANLKSANKAKVFYQVVYLLFAKIQDEKDYSSEKCKFVIYDREYEEINQTEHSESFENRINGLFESAKQEAEYKTVFDGTEVIDIPPLQIAKIVSELELVTVLNTDVKGEAFQAFLSAHYRGDAGQYFTPDPIKTFMIEILKPELNEVVLDPACGSGGFLVFTIEYYRRVIKIQQGWVDPQNSPLSDEDLTNEQLEILKLKIKNIANTHIKGIDFDNDLTKVAKMYMVMIDDGHSGIHTSDALLPFQEIEKNTLGDLKKGSVDVLMTNPPFGTKGKVRKKNILEEFDLGHKWIKSGEKFTIGETLTGKGKEGGQVPDILFIERCVDLLKPGGRMGIVLPNGDLNNKNTEFVRYWLARKMQIVASISIPSTAFDPYGAKGIKTSVLFLKKPKKGAKLPNDYPIFFANIEFIGYDTSGKPIYERNDGGEIVDTNGNIIPYKTNRKGEKTKQDEDLMKLNGAIKNDIFQMLNDWEIFNKKYNSYLW